MKHCSTCRHCVTDTRALMMGIYIKKCRVIGHNILHPFFSGFRCIKYRKARNGRYGTEEGNG